MESMPLTRVEKEGVNSSEDEEPDDGESCRPLPQHPENNQVAKNASHVESLDSSTNACIACAESECGNS